MTRQLSHERAQLLKLARQGPEYARAIAELVTILEGGEIDDRPVHPVTGERLDYPLTNEQCAAINHASLAKSEYGKKALAELGCDCDFCRHWRATNK